MPNPLMGPVLSDVPVRTIEREELREKPARGECIKLVIGGGFGGVDVVVPAAARFAVGPLVGLDLGILDDLMGAISKHDGGGGEYVPSRRSDDDLDQWSLPNERHQRPLPPNRRRQTSRRSAPRIDRERRLLDSRGARARG
jgi:hypothetical protein